jgi:hypothetical protein
MKKLYTLSISQPGYIFVFRGKKLRTPVEFKNITIEEVDILKTQALRNAIQYIVEEEKRIGE